MNTFVFTHYWLKSYLCLMTEGGGGSDEEMNFHSEDQRKSRLQLSHKKCRSTVTTKVSSFRRNCVGQVTDITTYSSYSSAYFQFQEWNHLKLNAFLRLGNLYFLRSLHTSFIFVFGPSSMLRSYYQQVRGFPSQHFNKIRVIFNLMVKTYWSCWLLDSLYVTIATRPILQK